MYEQRRKHAAPVLVDDRFLEGLALLVGRVQQKLISLIAEQAKVSGEELRRALDSQDTPDIYDYTNVALRKLHARATTPSFNLSFHDGGSVETTNLDEVRAELKLRSAEAESLKVTIGEYSTFRAALDVGNRIGRSCEWQVQGDRADVRDIDQLFAELAANGEPPNAFLYRPDFWLAVTIGVLALAGFEYFALRAVILPQFGLPRSAPGTWEYFAGALFGWVAASATGKVQALFPRTAFAFGRSAQRRSTKQVVIWQALTVLGAPAILSIIASLVQAR